MQRLLTRGIGHTKFKKSELGEIPQDWTILPLENITEKVSVGIATSTTKHFVKEGIPLLRNQNIKEDYIDTTDLMYITEEFSRLNSSRALKEGDVICVRTGYPGQSAVVPSEMNGWHTFRCVLKSSWGEESITVQNKQHIAEILCDTFPVEYKVAYRAVSNSDDWASEVYRTPNWSITKTFTMEDVSGDSHLSGGMSHTLGLQYLFTEYQKVHPTVIEEMMKQTFVRALFYLMTASSRYYNYFPDAIRIPVVAFLSRIYSQEVYKAAKEIITNLDKTLAKEINVIQNQLGYRPFEIRVPSAFSMILKDCKKRQDILSKAIELRNSPELKKFRHELVKLENSARNLDSKFLSKKKQLESILEPEEYDWESIFIQNLPKMSDIDSDPFPNPSVSLIKPLARPIDTFAQIGVMKLIKYLRNRNLVYLRNLGKQLRVIKSSQNNIEHVFGSKLSNEDIRILMKLRAYQSKYLNQEYDSINFNTKYH